MASIAATNGFDQVNFRVVKITLLSDPSKKTRGFADVRLGPCIIHGFAIIEGKNGGLFVAPPARLSKDGKNYPYVHLDEDFKAPFAKAVLESYRAELKNPTT